MKKSMLAITLTGLISFLSFSNAHAQFLAKTDRSDAESLNSLKAVASEKVNLNALKNFRHDYKDAKNTEWSVLKDNSFLCRFDIAGIPYRAFYTDYGKWLLTISNYSGKQLNQDVHDRVQSVYYNYQITFANQINLPGNRTIYLVEIQDENSIKKVRVTDEEMEVVLDLALK